MILVAAMAAAVLVMMIAQVDMTAVLVYMMTVDPVDETIDTAMLHR